jgi:hypothetical protein
VSRLHCGTCGRSIEGNAAFHFQMRGQWIYKCFSCALRHKPTLKRSLIIALIVGTILLAINQGDLLVRGVWSSAFFWKIPLTYLVPFVVATCGALGSSRVTAPNEEA